MPTLILVILANLAVRYVSEGQPMTALHVQL